MKYLFFLIVGCSLLLFSCEEANNNDPAVVITKISPFNHQVYDFNDTAFFKITFSDNSLITSTSLRLYLATGKDLLNMSFKPNNKIASIDTFLIMNDSAYTFVNFDIVAEDDAGNSSSKSSHIHIRL
jgi:hypothetical protein